ncbi:MAG TPA: hypothetical protein DEO41_03720 [Betaproteobacteria bacterium]|nr:hypothetical protein [Betaproteobacteria bacterium]
MRFGLDLGLFFGIKIETLVHEITMSLEVGLVRLIDYILFELDQHRHPYCFTRNFFNCAILCVG